MVFALVMKTPCIPYLKLWLPLFEISLGWITIGERLNVEQFALALLFKVGRRWRITIGLILQVIAIYSKSFWLLNASLWKWCLLKQLHVYSFTKLSTAAKLQSFDWQLSWIATFGPVAESFVVLFWLLGVLLHDILLLQRIEFFQVAWTFNDKLIQKLGGLVFNFLAAE